MASRPNITKGAARLNRLIDLNAYPIQPVLRILLKDRTTGENIIWATNNYEKLGNTYHSAATMRLKDLVKLDKSVIQPRVYKTLELQKQRTKVNAEVFTPSWICCLMNNHLDDIWFGRKDVFNKMKDKSWRATNRPIEFPASGSKTWQGYVDSRRIEITCGEAPYLVSRYDTTTGKVIPISHRIGILDRKLRVVNENAENEAEWIKWTLRAYQATYGYEYQGDNLLIARINMLMTFVDYMQARWERNPTEDELKAVAFIISWNVWQMNGLTYKTSYDADADRKRLQKIIDECDELIRLYDERINPSAEDGTCSVEETQMIDSMLESKKNELTLEELIEIVKQEDLYDLAYLYADYHGIRIIDGDVPDYSAELDKLRQEMVEDKKDVQRLRDETYAEKCMIADSPDCLIKNWRMRRTEYFRDIAQKNKGKGIMKFDFCIGNPPYQGANHQQIYTDFYLGGRCVANCVEMIFPIGWQEPKTANNLSKLNKQEIKADKQIVFIDNKQNVFPGIAGAEWTNILLWRRGYDNGLDGEQLIYTNGETPTQKKLIWDKSDVQKPKEIVQMAEIVTKTNGFAPMTEKTSVLKPYGLRTDVFDPRDKDGNSITVMQKYGLPELLLEKEKEDDVKILGLYNRKLSSRYISKDYPLPRKSEWMDKYRVLIGKAWGNFSDSYLGGAYADIIIVSPNEICTENYLESGYFDNLETATKHAKYLMTHFCRALLYRNKHTQDNSKDKWEAVPIQDFSEDWWDKSIAEIDDCLFEKYDIPENIKKFVKENIQTRTEANIINF